MARYFTLGQLKTRAQQRCDLENSDLISSAEWSGLASSAYGEFYSELSKVGSRYFERIRTISTVAKTNATGAFTSVAAASLVQGETLVLNDGYGELTFEFDLAGASVWPAGTEQMDVSGSTTATDVSGVVRTAINNATHEDARAFAITATPDSADLTLTHDETGEIGNQESSESVANAGLVLTDMTGGGETYRLPSDHLSTLAIYYADGSGQWVPLKEMMSQEYHRYSLQSTGGSYSAAYSVQGQFLRLLPFPPSGQTYKLHYLPQNPDLTSRSDSYRVDVVTPAGEEFIVSHMAVNALAKEGSEIGGHIAARERMREQITEWAFMRSFHELRSPMVDDQLYRDEDEYPLWPGRQ